MDRPGLPEAVLSDFGSAESVSQLVAERSTGGQVTVVCLFWVKTTRTKPCSKLPMVRMVAAFLVAVAVALLPPAGDFSGLAHTQVDGALSIVTVEDCCEVAPNCPDQSGAACADMFVCAIQCGAMVPALPAESRSARLSAVGPLVVLAHQAQLLSAAAAPPFRPPTISIRA